MKNFDRVVQLRIGLCLSKLFLMVGAGMENAILGDYVGDGVKSGFHYPSSRPEFTGRVNGP